tara:strand:- start:1119 stop:1811 length:693 start_codon:yes stop_codon:yes gene_type:complete
MTKILSFDGNIGSGKSTIVKYFQKNFNKYCEKKNKYLKVCFLEEPVDTWESIKDKNTGNNIIQKFYENNEKYAFSFQMMAYITRLSLLKKALEKDYDIIITERSIYTDKHVFAEMLHKSKIMEDVEYEIYNKWFDEFSDVAKNIKTVYIRTCPEICNKRVNKRNRDGENIPLKYLKDCHYYHDIWLFEPDKLEKGNILVIDGNKETNTSLFIKNQYFDIIMEKVYNFIQH